MGETVRGHYGEVIFISGAIPAQNLELDLEETTFDENTWSYIYQEVKVHFSELEVVGWFLSRMGFSTELNDMIVKLHMDNFYGEDKVLYIMDSLEGESAFYMREGEGLRRQSGYFVYYARNEAMQNFMILTNQNQNPEGKNEIEQKDEAVMRNYKRIMEERAKSARLERMNQRLAGFCSGLTIAVLALGIAVFSNYQMLEKMEDRLVENGLLASGVTFYTEDLQEELQEASARVTSQKENTTVDNKTESSTTESPIKVTTLKNDNEKVQTATNTTRYYTVQVGDTLSSISFKMYNSVGYVADIMAANGLSEADEIHEGDQIIIPDVE